MRVFIVNRRPLSLSPVVPPVTTNISEPPPRPTPPSNDHPTLVDPTTPPPPRLRPILTMGDDDIRRANL